MFNRTKFIALLSMVTLVTTGCAGNAPATANRPVTDSPSNQVASDRATTNQATGNQVTFDQATSNQAKANQVAKDAAAAGYNRVMREGQEYFCKKGVATGSRLRTKEDCFTPVQFELEMEHIKEQLRNNQTSDESRK